MLFKGKFYKSMVRLAILCLKGLLGAKYKNRTKKNKGSEYKIA